MNLEFFFLFELFSFARNTIFWCPIIYSPNLIVWESENHSFNIFKEKSDNFLLEELTYSTTKLIR